MQNTHTKLRESQAQVQTEIARYEDLMQDKEKELEKAISEKNQKVKKHFLKGKRNSAL